MSREAGFGRLTADSLGWTIHSIYAAVGDTALWSHALEHLSDALGGSGAVIFATRRDTGFPLFSGVGKLDPYYLDLYNQHYLEHDLRIPRALAFPLCTPVTEGMLVGEQEYRNSLFYNEFLRPQGLYHVLGSILMNDRELIAAFGIQRYSRQDEFSCEELKFAAQIMPHLQRALQLQIRLDSIAAERNSMFGMLDRLEIGVIILGTTGKVVHLNAAADVILSSRDGLFLEQGELTAAQSQDAQALRRLISGAVATGRLRGTCSGGIVRIARPSLKRPFQVVVSPFPRPGIVPGGITAALFVTDPETSRQVPLEILRGLYDLSRAEAQLAALLVTGLTLQESATRLRVSLNTVRTQLKQVFEKTGVSRQADLIRLVCSGPAGLRWEGPPLREE